MVENNRKVYIDMAKGIGILLVIFGHAVPSAELFVAWQCTFFMPLFFICSGLCYKNAKSLRESAKKILLPYYVWGGVGLVLEIGLMFLDGDAGLIETLSKMVKFTLGMNMWNYPLWFLVAFFVSKSIFDWIMSLQLGKRTKGCQVVLAGVFFVSGLLLGYARKRLMIFFPFRFDVGFTMVPFMMLGFYVKRLAERMEDTVVVKKMIVLCAMLAVNLICFKNNSLVSVNSSDYGNPVLFVLGAVSGSFFIILLCQCLKDVFLFRSVLGWFGKMSQTIMCTHAIVLLFLTKSLLLINHYIGASSGLINVAAFICCVVAVVPICMILKRTKIR